MTIMTNQAKANSLGERLDKCLQEKKISQADLERMSGVKQQTISYLIRTSAKSSSYAIRIASALQVNPVWLQEGIGDPHDPTVAVGSGTGVTSVRARWIPQLDMNSEVAGFVKTGEAPAEARRVSVMFDVGERAFSMEVSGRSMEPDLKPGDEVIIDPAVAPQPGDYVIAECDGAWMLRKYRGITRDAYELVPANPDFPTISSSTNHCQVVGTVLEHRRRLRANL